MEEFMVFASKNHLQLVHNYFFRLYAFSMSWNGKYRRSAKYNIGVLFFGFFWISGINCSWNRSSRFARLKTIFNLYILFLCPLYLFSISWNGKYWGPVKYSNWVLFFSFLWITGINFFWNRSSRFSHLKSFRT